MSSELFEEWVREIDQKFDVAKRKTAIINDNCKAHPHVEHLEWVTQLWSYVANGPKDHSFFKDKILVIGAKAIDTELGKKVCMPAVSILLPLCGFLRPG